MKKLLKEKKITKAAKEKIMKAKIEEIIREAAREVALEAEVKSMYETLISSINAELAKVTGPTQPMKMYTLRSWDYTDATGNTMERKIIVDLNWHDNNGIMTMYLGKADEENEWEWKEILYPSVKQIRLFASKLPDILASFAKNLTTENEANMKVVEILSKATAGMK